MIRRPLLRASNLSVLIDSKSISIYNRNRFRKLFIIGTQHMSVTLEDISNHLGLSVSTVSKALNAYDDVAPRTKQRVVDAAEELGYHPNVAARSLRRGRTDRIGLLTDNSIGFLRDYLGEVVPGAAMATEARENNLVLYTAANNRPNAVERICRAREVDGVVLIWASELEQVIATLSAENVPFVVLGRSSDDPDVSYIVANNKRGAYELTAHLIEQGHTRIGFTTRPELVETNAERFAGYCQALDDAGVTFDRELIIPTRIEPNSGYKAMQTFLDRPAPPTAVFAFHDLLAVDALRAIEERGLRVPDDMALAGFEGLRSSLTTDPPITTVAQPLGTMGRMAVEMLFKLIDDKAQPAQQVTVSVELQVRRSTIR
jgi:DNA-binding LacI/PurR family transcriptional regulator